MPVKSRPGESPGDGVLFFSNPDTLPAIDDAERARAGLQHWDEQIAKLEDPAEIDFARSLAEDPLAGRLLKAIFANSPFLSQCIFISFYPT
jgi:glutamate-ammonia-ligase adenylyltransferase